MQGRRGGRDPFFDFGDPFAGFGGFGNFGPPRGLVAGFGGFGNVGPGRLAASFFGGRDPFDDPFFTRPFGESSPFAPTGFPFPPHMQPSGFLEHQGPEPSRQRGPIIQELNSDGEEEDAEDEKKENPRKHGRSNNQPFVEHPDDEVGGKKSKHLQLQNEYNRFNQTVPQPQTRNFCFQSSTVTYGGPSGTYYTSSRTRRTGSDGVTFDESKEANSATGQASHRMSRGIHDKGHSLSRKLNSDGKVDTMQTLHNLNEDELAGFEEEWKGKGQKYMPGWTRSIGASSSGQADLGRQGRRALPSTEQGSPMETAVSEVRDELGGSSLMRESTRTGPTDRNAYYPGRPKRN